jgi:subtilisin family serine protease
MIFAETRVGREKLFTKPKKHRQYIPGQILLRIPEDAVQPYLATGLLNYNADAAKRLPENVWNPINYLRKNAGLSGAQPLFSTRQDEFNVAEVSSWDRAKLAVMSSVFDSEIKKLSGIVMFSLDTKKNTPELVKHLKQAKTIDYAEQMPARWMAGNAGASADPKRNLQWGLRAIDWFNAKIPSADKIRVGILDTGIDTEHPDLKNLDIFYDTGDFKKEDILGHGTHVAGIIAATTNDDAGITGVAKCKLSIWKIFPDQPTYGEFYVDGERYLQALYAVLDGQVKVVNLSIGGAKKSQTEEILFGELESNGVVVVAAMGNEYKQGNPTSYPAAYPGVIAVGAIAENYQRSYFSNTGKHIALMAPGSNIFSTLPTGKSDYLDETGYGSWSGTSMATPYVAGAAALVAAKFPKKDAPAIRKHLTKNTRRLSTSSSGWSQTYGWGLLNLKNALP